MTNVFFFFTRGRDKTSWEMFCDLQEYVLQSNRTYRQNVYIRLKKSIHIDICEILNFNWSKNYNQHFDWLINNHIMTTPTGWTTRFSFGSEWTGFPVPIGYNLIACLQKKKTTKVCIWPKGKTKKKSCTRCRTVRIAGIFLIKFSNLYFLFFDFLPCLLGGGNVLSCPLHTCIISGVLYCLRSYLCTDGSPFPCILFCGWCVFSNV